MSASDRPRKDPRPKYQPPVVEDVPISPEERLLVACKATGSINPACEADCSLCSTPGS
jgi:hypothetical protein